MSLKASLPGYRDPIVGQGGLASRPVYTFFQAIATTVDSLSDQIGNATTTPADSPISENANVVGKYSIYTRGILKTGIVSVLLIGDVETPGNTQYYGSDATGEKGWHAVSDALDSTANITLTVGTDGVTTFDLADLANSGAGAALVKLTRDAKGRISGTSAATTDDLAEGSTNLWFTNERAQDAVGAALDGTGNVPLSYNDAGNAISAALSSGVLASLSLAGSSVQPGDNVSSLTNDAGYLTDSPSDGQQYARKDGGWVVVSGGSGSGDVVGPASAADSDVALFDGTTGKLLKDGGSFGSLVLSAALTGLSTATSAVIAATDTVLGALGKLQAQITDNLLPSDFIDGLQPFWTSATAVGVRAGAAYIQGSGKVIRATSDLSLSSLSLTASAWSHLYVKNNGSGALALEASATAPAAAYSGSARSKSGDTTRRYVGSVLTDASGNIYKFLQSGNVVMWENSIAGTPFFVLNAGRATTATNVACAGSVPVTAKVGVLIMATIGTADAAIGNADMSGSLTSSTYLQYVGSGVQTTHLMPLDSSQRFSYLMTASVSSGGFYARVCGYIMER